MEDSRYYHRVFPSLPQTSAAAPQGELLRPAAPGFNPPAPKGQRVPAAQLLLEEEMRQAAGSRRKRR
ncbi:MAG: hypothetical protein M0T72_12075 [Candidatus Dormibacteraeota bacterium]|nr:hypothetical protein [Candidatus Dormibacteraeota bacterium]